MSLTSRTGAAPLAFLLGGIALVIVIFAFATMGNQAKASADLKTKLDDANNTLAAAGLPASTTSSVKGASTDTAFDPKKTKTYTKKFTGWQLSFGIPTSLQTKEIDAETTEFASKSDLFGQSSIPKGEILIKCKFNVTLNLPSLESYLERTPYATDHQLELAAGRQAMVVRNEYDGLKWDQLILANSPQGPYTLCTYIPTGAKATQLIDLFTATAKVEDGAK